MRERERLFDIAIIYAYKYYENPFSNKYTLCKEKKCERLYINILYIYIL